MKTILLALLTLTSLNTMIAEEQNLRTLTFGAKLNPYRAYPESKQFSFFADITINESTKIAEIIVTSYEDMGITPCDFEKEVVEQITRHVALWLKNNTAVKIFSLAMTHPNGTKLFVKELDVEPFAVQTFCWQGIYCIEYSSVNY